MVDLQLTVVTLEGQEYVLFKDKEGGEGWAFPHGTFDEGESPGAAAKRLVKAWTGTTNPKLELMDFLVHEGALEFVFRAFLLDTPDGEVQRQPRGGLPERVGRHAGDALENMQKTSLSYKLTRG